jgi:hypothetical protein
MCSEKAISCSLLNSENDLFCTCCRKKGVMYRQYRLMVSCVVRVTYKQMHQIIIELLFASSHSKRFSSPILCELFVCSLKLHHLIVIDHDLVVKLACKKKFFRKMIIIIRIYF